MKKYFIKNNGIKKEVTKKEFMKKAYRNMIVLEKRYHDEVIIDNELLEMNLKLQKYYQYFNRNTDELKKEYWEYWEMI